MRTFGILIAAAFFTAMVASGYYAGGKSWKGVVYLTGGTVLDNSRNPAAIKRDIDFSKLDGAELVSATQKRLVTAAHVIIREGLIGVELGHFVTRDESGQKRMACDTSFNRLSMRFDAEGIASDGEIPSMDVDAPCTTSPKDIASISPVWIPVSKILESRPINSSLTSEGVQFKFLNMSGSWPVSWRLRSVRLYNSQQADREINISARELNEIRPRPFVINWMEARRKPSAATN